MSTSRYEVRVTSAYPSYEKGKAAYKKYMGVIVSGLSQTATARTLVEVHETKSAPFPINPTVGQIWRVRGSASKHCIVRNNQELTLITVSANRHKLVSPSGDAWKALIAINVEGIGESTAKKIWDVVVASKRDNLFEKLGAKDVEYFLNLKVAGRTFLNYRQAEALIYFWQQYEHVDLIQWLIDKQLPADVSRKFALHYKNDSINIIEDNPYAILTFGGEFSLVDTVAMNTFSVSRDDPRRLHAAIEQSLHRHTQLGHTRATYDDLLPLVNEQLRDEVLSIRAFKSSSEHSYSYYQNPHTGEYHPTGLLAMEMVVAERLNLLARTERSIGDGFYDELEKSQGELGFKLVESQKKAVLNSCRHCLSVITGGAGVGKTAVTKVITDVLVRCGDTVILSALAGRAVMRLREATSRDAFTIAAILRDGSIHASVNNSFNRFTLLIDEASMIDLPTLYKLITLFGENLSIIFVGDPQQLPPIGAGLILHTLVNIKHISVSKLTVPQRFGHDTGIAEYSNLVGEGKIPESLSYKNIVYHELKSSKTAHEHAINLYLESPDNSQLLAATNSEITDINNYCQGVLNPDSPSIHVVFGDSVYETNYKINDPVIFISNIWKLNIQNGKFGEIVEVSKNWKCNDNGKKVAAIKGDEDAVFGKIRMEDGEIIHINHETIDHFRLAHCISVHKAQGSQFDRVISVLNRNRIVDRDWIYTSITRAKESVHIVDPGNLFKRRVMAVSNASARKTYLGELLCSNLELDNNDYTEEVVNL